MHIQWAAKIDQVLKKYLHPLLHFTNEYVTERGQLTYYQLWRALKTINIRTFNIDWRDVENVIIRVLRLKDKEAAKRNAETAKLEDSTDPSQQNYVMNIDDLNAANLKS